MKALKKRAYPLFIPAIKCYALIAPPIKTFLLEPFTDSPKLQPAPVQALMNYTFQKAHFLFLGKTSMWVDAVNAEEDGCIETVNKSFSVSEALI